MIFPVTPQLDNSDTIFYPNNNRVRQLWGLSFHVIMKPVIL